MYPPDLIVAGAAASVASLGHHEGRCQECQTVQQTISDTSTAQQMNEEFSAVQKNQPCFSVLRMLSSTASTD